MAKLIKYGGEGIRDAMNRLITMMWITEEMPQSWNTRMVCRIPKKGDKLKCKITEESHYGTQHIRYYLL
jgi:hypothetical protein